MDKITWTINKSNKNVINLSTHVLHHQLLSHEQWNNTNLSIKIFDFITVNFSNFLIDKFVLFHCWLLKRWWCRICVDRFTTFFLDLLMAPCNFVHYQIILLKWNKSYFLSFLLVIDINVYFLSFLYLFFLKWTILLDLLAWGSEWFSEGIRENCPPLLKSVS